MTEKMKEIIIDATKPKNTVELKMLDKIDLVLSTLYFLKDKESIWYYNLTSEILTHKRIRLTSQETHAICRKLHKEGYIECELKPPNTSTSKKEEHYKINFDGELLWLDGSYSEKLKKEQAEKDRITNERKMASYLQILLSFVGYSYSLYYVADLYLKGHHCLTLVYGVVVLLLLPAIAIRLYLKYQIK
jgi:hypothetical protein